jgi:hypothetical protein
MNKKLRKQCVILQYVLYEAIKLPKRNQEEEHA